MISENRNAILRMRTAEDISMDMAPVSARITKQVMKRLKFDEETIDTVVELVRYHDSDLHEKRRSIRTWLDRLGRKQFRRLLEVRRCDVSGQNPACLAERLARIHRLEALLDEVVEQTGQFYIKDLDINGSDLIQIGYTPGSSIGSTLSKLADQVVEGVMENKKRYIIAGSRPVADTRIGRAVTWWRPFLPFITLNMFGLLILGQNIIENHYHGQLASNRLRQFKHFKE